MTGTRVRFVAAVFFLLAGAICASAQPPMAPQGRGDEPPPLLTPGEIQKWFDAYMIVQAQQQLGISDDLYPKLIVQLKGLHETRRRNQQARNQIMVDLRRMLGRPRVPVTTDEGQIKDRLKALHDLEIRAADELRKAYAGVDELLSPNQQARFRLFEEEMERRKFDLLSRARSRAVPPRGRGGS